MSDSLSKLFRSPEVFDLATGPVAKPGPEFDFYLEHCRQAHGPILDLGCGTGRLTLPLSEYGCDISGLDLSKEMLDHAEAKAKSMGLDIYWIHDDFRRLSSVRRFGLIFMSSDTVNLLQSRSDFESLLHGVMAHLQPDGLFVFSVFNPNLKSLSENGQSRAMQKSHLQDHQSSKTLKSKSFHRYDVIQQQIHRQMAFSWNNGKPFLECSLSLRCLFPEELKNLLHYNGFDLLARYGDYAGADFEPDSPRQVIVARPKFR